VSSKGWLSPLSPQGACPRIVTGAPTRSARLLARVPSCASSTARTQRPRRSHTGLRHRIHPNVQRGGNQADSFSSLARHCQEADNQGPQRQALALPPAAHPPALPRACNLNLDGTTLVPPRTLRHCRSMTSSAPPRGSSSPPSSENFLTVGGFRARSSLNSSFVPHCRFSNPNWRVCASVERAVSCLVAYRG